MPSWKKVAVSGSSPTFNHITASGDISSSGELRGASLKVGTRSVTVEANSIINQDLTDDADAQFNSVVLSGATPIAFVGGANYSMGGDAPIDFDLLDNNSSALSFDASGKAGMLEFDTTNSSEKVKVSSDFIVAGDISASNGLFVGGNISSVRDVNVDNILTSNFITASDSILLPHTKTITFANTGNSIASSGELSTKNITITAEDDINLVVGSGHKVDINGDLDVDGTSNLDEVDIDGTVQIDGDTTFGVNGTGVDVLFYADTAGRNMRWNQSSDQLKLSDGVQLRFGTHLGVDSSDATILHNGTNTTFTNLTGELQIIPDGGTLRISGSGNTQLAMDGNISASGNAQVNQITASAFQFVGTGTAELEVQGNITASGNISASGNGLGHTLGGRVSINYGNGGSMTGSLSNGEGYGEIVQFGPMNSAVTKGDVVSYRNAGTGWIRADKDTGYAATSIMGVCIDPAADGSTALADPKILLKGVVRLGAGHIADTTGDEGDPVYLQDDGHVAFAAPTAGGDYVRIVGYVIDEDLDIIYLDPDKTWIEIAT